MPGISLLSLLIDVDSVFDCASVGTLVGMDALGDVRRSYELMEAVGEDETPNELDFVGIFLLDVVAVSP